MGQVGSRQEQFWEACSFGRVWLVKQMIDEGINVNWVSHVHDSCPIHVASQGKPDVVKLLIESGCIVDSLDFKKNTALHHAAMSGDSEICELLIRSNSNVNSVNQSGWTPLINAAYWNNYACLECLINNNCDITIRNNDGRTAIHELCRSKSSEDDTLLKSLSLLIECGANIHDKSDNVNPWDSEADFTPLLFATYHGHSKLVECLIDSGANVNERDRNGWTSLHWAAQRCHAEIVKLLLIFGAHTEARTNRGETAQDVTNDIAIIGLINPNNLGRFPVIISNGYVTTDDEMDEEENQATDDENHHNHHENEIKINITPETPTDNTSQFNIAKSTPV